MTQEQILSLFRTVMQIGGTFLVSKGVISAADWTTIMGAALMIVPVVWSLWAHSQTAMVAAMGRLAESPDSPVKGVILERTAAGTALANIIDSPAVVSAGSADAAAVAR